jgi:hypothetical protein
MVNVTVRAPTGVDRRVHDRLRQHDPELVAPHQAGPLEPWLQPLVRDYPQSPYLQGRRLRDLEYRMDGISNGYEPDDVPQTGTPDSPPPGPDMRPETVHARAESILPLAMELGEIPGPFQPDALLKLGLLYDMAGQPERGIEVFERIVRDFPGREAARQARGAVGDQIPPTLKVIASPAILWPPDHDLEPITVAVNLTDDTDSSPTVTLVAIECADSRPAGQEKGTGQGQPAAQGCDEGDVADASYGLDDREFRLRVQRAGSGPGRVYTITYEATDAAGNKARARTTVTVPHDKGNKK